MPFFFLSDLFFFLLASCWLKRKCYFIIYKLAPVHLHHVNLDQISGQMNKDLCIFFKIKVKIKRGRFFARYEIFFY